MDTCLDQLRQRLDSNGISYEVIAHSHVGTSQEASARLGISGYTFAKSVVLMSEEQPRLFVLRAADRVDTNSVRSQMNSSRVRIALEYEIHPLFPGCESGSVPAVPLREDLPVYLDSRLATVPSIVFEAGSGTEAVRMQMDDYRRLVSPTVLDFAEKPVRQRRRVARSTAWRRRAMQAAPFMLALTAMVFGRRVGRRSTPVRSFALGILAGAATSSLTDPRSGGYRRALLRDKPGGWLRRFSRRMSSNSRYLGGSLQGVRYQAGMIPRAFGIHGNSAPKL